MTVQKLFRLFVLLLTSMSIISIFADELIFEVPLNTLPNINYIDYIDVLGTDKSNQTAQIRVDSGYYLKNSDLLNYQKINNNYISASIEKYLNPDKLIEKLNILASKYPELVTLINVGTTTDSKNIKGLILSSNLNLNLNKPVILFNGMLHAREVMSTEVPYDIAEYLLTNYETNPEIRQWFNDYQIIIVPQVNPDGNALVHAGDRWWRKNTYKQNQKIYGVDLNRNYPYLWNGCNGSSGYPSSQTYRGPNPVSEPEAIAMINLVDKYKPVLAITYHSYGELILYPFGCKKELNDAKELFDSIGQVINNNIKNDKGLFGKYDIGTTAETIYEADGGDDDYYWKENNVIAYTIELNSKNQGFQPDYDNWRDKTVENQRGGWMSLLRRMNTGAVKVQLDPDLKNLTYRIKQLTENGYLKTFHFGENITQREPRKGNLVYQLLNNGNYIIEILQNNNIIFTEEFSINQDLVELNF